MWFLNVIWDHLSWGMCPRSRVTGNWLHIYRQEKCSWKSRHEILFKIDARHLMSTVFVPKVGFPSLPCTFSCQLQCSLAYHFPPQDQSLLLILGHLRSSTFVLPSLAQRTRAEANSGFSMPPGKGLITDCHFLDPQIKLPGCSRPVGRRPVPLLGLL